MRTFETGPAFTRPNTNDDDTDRPFLDVRGPATIRAGAARLQGRPA